MARAFPARFPGGRWALINGLVLDGDPAGYAGPGGLLLDSGRIVEAGPAVVPDAVPDVPQLDLRGRTVMPGLIDVHVHLAWSAGPTPVETLVRELADPGAVAFRVAANATATLHRGVTTARDLGGPSEILFACRDAISAGRLPGPRIVASGHVITRRTGHCHFIGRHARGPEEVRRATVRQIEAGADVVKIIVTGGVHTPGTSSSDVQYDRSTIRAAVETAHTREIPVTAHVTNRVGLARALAAGVDSVQHGGFPTPRQADLMADRGVALTPTVGTRRAIEIHGSDPAIPRAIVEKAGPTRDRLEGVRRCIVAGTRITAGTDAGTTYLSHGSIATEIALLASAGMSPRAAIATATSNATVELRMSGRLGVLSPGAHADLIVVDGDPTIDLTSLERILLVIRDGAPSAGPWLTDAVGEPPITPLAGSSGLGRPGRRTQ